MPDVIEIADGDELYRRVAPEHLTEGQVNSLAFKLRGKPDPSLSVELARLTTAADSLARAPRSGFRLGVLLAGAARELELNVRHDPLPYNEAHSLIEGAHTKAHCRRLAEATHVLDS